MVDLSGKQLDNYRLIRRLGTGAFGEVYLGKNIYEPEQVAIKVLKIEPTPETLKEFLNEARTFRLRHPNIIPLVDFGIDGEMPFLVMEYAPKGTLRQRHPSGTRLPLETVITYVKPVAAALQYAHEKRLVHRDVKPSNMLLGSHDEILLSDFGIAVAAHSEHSLSTQETLGGTIPYMAPEQIKGKPRPASDQYALGIVVYEWLCGERPFQGPDWNIINQHLSRLPVPLCEKNPAIPLAVEEVIQKALAKDPQERYPNIQDFARALEEASEQSEKQAITTLTTRSLDKAEDLQPPGPPAHTRGSRPRIKKNWAVALVALLVTALLISGGVIAFAQFNAGTGKAAHSTNSSLVTITITPDSKTVEDNYTIVGASTTNAQQRQVAVRNVLGSAQAPTITVKATGHNAHPATAAQGSLTFFNSSSVEQTIASGTVFTVNGVQIENDVAANIPAANLPTTGFVSVSAHALTTGAAGNIGSGVLNRSCCGNGITVRNDTFSGGQDAANYTFLQQSDMNGAISQATKDATKQNALTDLQKQVKSTEQSIGSAQCTPTISIDQPIGDKGSNVTSADVTYLIKCTATVYDSQGAQNIVRGLLTTKTSTSPGAGYGLVGTIQTSLTGQTETGNVLSLFFSAKGIWVYQFTDAQKLQLANAIAGKSIADAQSILNGTKGIGSARISYSGGNTLPTDPNQISIVIQPISGLPGSGSPTTIAPTVQSGTPPAVNGTGEISPPVGS